MSGGTIAALICVALILLQPTIIFLVFYFKEADSSEYKDLKLRIQFTVGEKYQPIIIDRFEDILARKGYISRFDMWRLEALEKKLTRDTEVDVVIESAWKNPDEKGM